MIIMSLLMSVTMAAQQQAPLEQAAGLLAVGDTARALKILRSEAQATPSMNEDALGAHMALLWIGRDRDFKSDKRRWRIKASTVRPEPDLGDQAAVLVNAYLLDRDDRKGPDSATQRKILGSTARVLDANTDGSITAGTAHWVLAEYFLIRADRAFVSRIPSVSELPEDCDEKSPICFTREPVLDRALALSDARRQMEEFGTALDSASSHLLMAARSPWPLNEMALRSLTAVRWIFGSSGDSVDLVALIRASDLMPLTRYRLAATLLEAAGMRDSSWVIMRNHPEEFASLDEDLGGLLKAKQLSTPAYWRTGWPFFLAPYNERLVAHRNRLIAAEQLVHLLPQSREVFGLTDIARRIVRVGLPEGVAMYDPPDDPSVAFQNARRKLIWYLDAALHETLLRGGPMGRMSAQLDLGLAARRGESARTISGFNAGGYTKIQSFDHQVVQFFRNGRPEVDISARIPGERCERSEPVTGLFILNARLGLIRQTIDTVASRLSHRSTYKLDLDPGAYVYSLEMLDTACSTARRARYVLSVRADTSETFQVSDIALVREADLDQPTRITGARPVVLKTELRAAAGQPLGLYWEIYGMPSDSVERKRFQIRLRLINLHPKGESVDELGRLVRRVRRTMPNTIAKYDASLPAGAGPVGIALTVDIPKNADGIHMLQLEIKDKVTGKTAFLRRAVFIQGQDN